MNAQGYKNQQGMVLILAMFIVALVTTIVVSVSWRFTLNQARNENRWHGSQARMYLESGEQAAIQALLIDLETEQAKVDHRLEQWAMRVEAPMDEGYIAGQIEDAHGRINVNLLKPPFIDRANFQDDAAYRKALENRPKYSPAQLRFMRLLQMIELEEGTMEMGEVVELMDAIADWLDQDQNPTGFGGAEKSYYEDQEPPVNIADGPMTTVSDLLVIKGMTPEIYEKILPYVIALPEDAKMNINTVPDALLRTFGPSGKNPIVQPLEDPDWQALVEDRNAQQEGYQDVKSFVESPLVSALLKDEAGNVDEGEFTVRSHYFIVHSETLVGEQVRRGKSLLFRNDKGEVHVIRRTDANF